MYDEKKDYLGDRRTASLNGLENNVGNRAFAQFEQLLYFPQCFQ